jgi:hypothetical protein
LLRSIIAIPIANINYDLTGKDNSAGSSITTVLRTKLIFSLLKVCIKVVKNMPIKENNKMSDINPPVSV